MKIEILSLLDAPKYMNLNNIVFPSQLTDKTATQVFSATQTKH